MSEQIRTPEQEPAGDDDARRQLWIRAGVAGGLISLLLGGLALFDHLSRPAQPEEVALPTKPIAPAQITPDAGRDAPPDVVRAGGEGAVPDDVPPALAPEGSAPPSLPDTEAGRPDDKSDRLAEGTRPEGTVAPGARPPARPANAAATAIHGDAPRAPARELMPVKPAATVPPTPAAPVAAVPASAPRPSGPAAVVAPVVSSPGRPALAAPVAPSVPQVAAVAAPAVMQKPAQPSQSQPSPQPVTAEAGRGYVLQFGFFSNVASAEEMKARLAQAGVPSQIETRLIVGPFADRKDALAAQARLREKGVDVGVLLPLGR
ncbi:SPOR domain-containing protein [Zoogloea sp.]|jgi:cell division protein FtsN|uniref:SPOR domain-containing protein n=1 Tax=Zoogloea sp. TaxID=49181 RepID=UPI0037DA0AAB